MPTALTFNIHFIYTPLEDNFTILTGNVNGTDVFYNLQINNLQLDYGARYACQNAGDTTRVNAYVVALGEN